MDFVFNFPGDGKQNNLTDKKYDVFLSRTDSFPAIHWLRAISLKLIDFQSTR